MSDPYLDIRPGETWQDAWRRKVWSDVWKGFEPDTPRDPAFHVGCVTLILSALVGVPAGYLIARDAITHNAGPFGAFAGFLAVMFGLGFLARRRQKGLGSGAGALGRGMGRLLRDRALWACTLVAGAATATFGPRMAREVGEPVSEWVAALAILGVVIGFALGVVLYLLRNLVRGRFGGRERGAGRGAGDVRPALERQFLHLMKPELDAMMLPRVRREQAARAFVAGLVANAPDSSPTALGAELVRAIEREKQNFRERRTA